jgi:SynChlorMet cassette radical SAM/SPASM protein ScmE
MDVTLQGGEPFCRPDLAEIITGIVKNRMRFSILTNGTLITKKLANRIASTGRCDMIQVSIDSSISASHDAMRGKGSFARAIAGIGCLQEYKIPVTVRVTINKRNVNDLEGVAKLLLEEIGLPGFSTNSATYLGLCKQNSNEVELSAQERSQAMRTLLALNKKYNGRISASAGPLAEANAWSLMVKAHKEKKKAMPNRGFLVGCGGIMSKIGVRADGVIVPCLMISHFELGKINQDSLKDIWQNNPQLKRLRSRYTLALGGFEFCQGCEYIPYCTGSCPATAYTAFGKENHPSPDSCLRRFIAQGGELPDEALLLEKINS